MANELTTLVRATRDSWIPIARGIDMKALRIGSDYSDGLP